VGLLNPSLAHIADLSDIAQVKTIVLSPSAAKAFDKLTLSARVQCRDALNAYAIQGVGDTKTMVGTPTVRLRSGDFRIIFDEEATRIVVQALGHRKDIYR
jgi:mRNA-degrading endonuclease RelE of RelBE toxin-antitoxin system